MKSFKKITASVCALVMLSAITTSVAFADDILGASVGTSETPGTSNVPGASEVPGTSDKPVVPGESEKPSIGESQTYVKGDANEDGKVSTLDLLLVKKYLLGKIDILGADADVNGDGKVSTLDLLLVKKILLGTYVAE